MAAPTETSICNSALIKLGVDRINSLTENKKSAILCNEQYPKLRDEVLVSHPWNFSIRRITLAKLSSTPLFGFVNEFQLPTDCLRVLSTEDDKSVPYKVEGRKLLTDNSDVKILYISQVTDTSQYSPRFVEALALRIAVELSYSLISNTNITSLLIRQLELHMSRSRSVDAQEGTPDDLVQDTFIEARFAGAGTGVDAFGRPV